MSSFVLNRNYALQLPNSFVEVDREEMEYVDGGANWFTNWAMSVGTIGGGLNVAIAAALPVSGGIAAFTSSVGKKTAARYLEGAVVNKLKLMGIAVGGYIVSRGLELALDSLDVGGAFARWMDSFDTTPNNGIVWFGN